MNDRTQRVSKVRREWTEEKPKRKNMKPESVVVELTNHCNARCEYCTNRFMKREKGFMSGDVFQKIIGECSNLKDLKSIEPQMHGEPTLHPEFMDYIRYIGLKVPHAKINLISNGIFLTEEIVASVNHVDISFNYADYIDFYVGTGLELISVESKINSLKAYKDKITIHFVLTKETALDYFIIKDTFPDFEVAVNPLFNTWNGRIPDRNYFNFTKKIECDRRKRQLVILWNGDAALCCNDYEGETTKDIGNIMDSSIEELFDKVYNYKGDFCKTCNSNVEVNFYPAMLSDAQYKEIK